MKNKILPLFLIFAIIITGAGIKKLIVQADDATTGVTVGNTVPAFNTGYEPHEDPVSDGTTPTNVGSVATFKGIATDANGDQWKLLICKSAGTTGVACTGDTFCNTTVAVNSNTEASCTYTALVGDTQSNDWYGYACDSVGCSGESHKVDSSGPPFKVNHSPAFTVYADDGPKGPAATITWTTTASDPDSDTAQDTVSLYVCKAADFNGSTCGVAGTWCSDTGKANNPTCYTTTPRPDGDYAAYGYVLDSHGFVSAGTAQGTDSSPTVTNSSPSITASSINLLNTTGSGNLTLTGEQTETPNFKVTFIVNDENSCKNITNGDEIASALINVRMSEKIQTACDATGEYDANDCYPDAYATWNPVCVASSTVDSCTGNTDTSVGWACTFPLQYHADPTVADTPKADYNWVAAVKASDDDVADTGLIDSTTYSNEMDKFMSYDLNTASISYGTVAPNNDSTQQTTIVEATGNVGLDENLSGGIAAGKGMCVTDYPTCSGSYINTEQQKYNLTTGLGWEGAGATALAYSSAESELNCAKTTVTGTPATKDTYWYLRVPTGQAVGSYTGSNIIGGKVDNETYGS